MHIPLYSYKTIPYRQYLSYDGPLTHCPLGDVTVSPYLQHFMLEWCQVNATKLQWWDVNIGSGNGLVPSGNKPLPDPVLTKTLVAIWRH